MKKLLLLLLIPMLFSGCDKENFNNRNPYIPNYSFSETINMSLPGYSNLQFASNAIYYPGGGAMGLIIFNAGGGNYKAYDAACPNQTITSCSTMQVDGINAICPCDSQSYNLFTGQSQGMEYPMKPYRVEVNGMVLTVYN